MKTFTPLDHCYGMLHAALMQAAQQNAGSWVPQDQYNDMVVRAKIAEEAVKAARRWMWFAVAAVGVGMVLNSVDLVWRWMR
jgi:hypothetical protein